MSGEVYCVEVGHWHVYPVPTFVCVPGDPERRDRELIARHLRAAASAINIKDWPAYLHECADGHLDGTSWYKP